MRISALALVASGFLALLACSPDRSPSEPDGTPDCATACNDAWACGGVLENDLDQCIALCDEEEHQDYRICVFETACETMNDCKRYGPSDVQPVDTDDTDAG